MTDRDKLEFSDFWHNESAKNPNPDGSKNWIGVAIDARIHCSDIEEYMVVKQLGPKEGCLLDCKCADKNRPDEDCGDHALVRLLRLDKDQGPFRAKYDIDDLHDMSIEHFERCVSY